MGQITAILQDVAGSQYACSSGTAPLTAAQVLGTMPASFVKRTVLFDATVNVFEEHQAGVGPTTADLEDYFNAHASTFDTACFTVAEYTSSGRGAGRRSPGGLRHAFCPGGASRRGRAAGLRHPLWHCLVAPRRDEPRKPPLNTVSSPISISSNYLLVQITKRTPTPFAKAKPEVRAAVESAGADKARSVINAAEKKATIGVDGRYGQWAPPKAEIVPPPVPPLAVDVLNTAVNSPATTIRCTVRRRQPDRPPSGGTAPSPHHGGGPGAGGTRLPDQRGPRPHRRRPPDLPAYGPPSGGRRLSGFVALDHLYESSPTFSEVYAAIVEELVEAASAAAPEAIVYAVPGSPLIAERTVELLRHDQRVDVTVVPGIVVSRPGLGATRP